MSEAPERIWLTGFVKDEYGARLGRGTISDLDHGQNPDYPEYVSADRIEELEAELNLMKTSGIVEVAVRNQNVMEYIKHWEGRAEAAEAKLAKAMEALDWCATVHESSRARTTIAELKGEK